MLATTLILSLRAVAVLALAVAALDAARRCSRARAAARAPERAAQVRGRRGR